MSIHALTSSFARGAFRPAPLPFRWVGTLSSEGPLRRSSSSMRCLTIEVLQNNPKEKATDAWPGDVDCGTLRTKATRGEAARSSYALLRFRRRLGRVLRHGLGRRFCGLPNDCTQSCPCYARVTTGGELWQVKRLPSSFFGQVSTVLRCSAAEVASVTNTTYGVGSCTFLCS